MTVTISKWGNSQGFRIPKDILDNLEKWYLDFVINVYHKPGLCNRKISI